MVFASLTIGGRKFKHVDTTVIFPDVLLNLAANDEHVPEVEL